MEWKKVPEKSNKSFELHFDFKGFRWDSGGFVMWDYASFLPVLVNLGS